MSADNYYTVKFDREGLQWYVLHGFMSDLESDVPTLLRGHEKPYDDYKDALGSVHGEYAEYGIIQEPSPLDEILTRDQWRTYLERTIRLAQEHLDWINGVSDE